MNWVKYIIMAAIGALISLAIDIIIPFDHPNHNRIYDYIFSIIMTIFIWEGTLFIDRKLNSSISWVTHTFKRIIIQLPLSIAFSAISIYAVMILYNKYVCVLPEDLASALFKASIIVGTLFSIILLGVEISVLFLNQWKMSLTEVEKYKSESLQAQLHNLKDQINPHFLFNNMSVLSSLVYKDPDKAVEFINRLSKVYRYLLDNKDTELVTLEAELNFIQSYIYLLEVRFDKNIVITFQIGEGKKQLLLPPMALQMLIENCVKHNEVSEQQPLCISINAKEKILEIKNSLQLRQTFEESSKTGLSNIRKRYAFFTTIEVDVTQTEKEFIVKLPLLIRL